MDLTRVFLTFNEMNFNLARFAIVCIPGVNSTTTYVLTTSEADFNRLRTQSMGFDPAYPSGVYGAGQRPNSYFPEAIKCLQMRNQPAAAVAEIKRLFPQKKK